MISEDILFEEVIATVVDERFIERRWLADLVEGHLADPGCRFVLLLGGPGTGKTSFVSWMTRRHEVSPRYFIRRESIGTFAGGDARSVLLRIGHQLALLVPDIMGREITATVAQQVDEVTGDGKMVGIRVGLLRTSPFRRTALHVVQQAGAVQGTVIGLEIDQLITDQRLDDLGNLQYLALLDPAVELARRTPDAVIVVLLDALDELRHQAGFFSGGEDVLDWLAQLPQLPNNIRIILTSRPDESLRSLQVRQRPWLRQETLTDSADRVAADLRAYVDTVLTEPAIAAALAPNPVTPARLGQVVVDQAAGNFLYLVLWAEGVRKAVMEGDGRRLVALTSLAGLPAGLDGIYEYFLVLVYDGVRLRIGSGWRTVWQEVYRPLLGVLSAAQDSLSSEQLMTLCATHVGDRRAIAALADLSEFLIKDGAGIRLCHGSLAEFLFAPGILNERSPWNVDPFGSHFEIARRFIAANRASWANCADDYALANVVRHGVLATREARTDTERADAAAQLAELLREPSYGLAKATRMRTEDVLLDYVAGYEAIESIAANRVPDLVEGLAAVLAQQAASTDEPVPETLHAVLGYHPRGGSLNAAVLARLTDTDAISDVIADPQRRTLTVLGFAHGSASRLRRSGDPDNLRRAREILQQAIAGTERLSVGEPVETRISSLTYDLAYLDFLHGDIAGADEWFQRSVAAAERAGSRTKATISQLVALTMHLYAGTVEPAACQIQVENALTYFSEEATGPHAQRWIMNCQSILLDLACETSDADLARTQLERLEQDPWLRQLAQDHLLRGMRGRTAVLLEDWPRAIELFTEHLADELTGEPSAREGLARDFLHYGRALVGIGRIAQARTVWERGLRCPDHAANWPWKPRIRRELTVLDQDSVP